MLPAQVKERDISRPGDVTGARYFSNDRENGGPSGGSTGLRGGMTPSQYGQTPLRGQATPSHTPCVCCSPLPLLLNRANFLGVSN